MTATWTCGGCRASCTCAREHTRCDRSSTGYHHDGPDGGRLDYGPDSPMRAAPSDGKRVRIPGLTAPRR